MMSELINYRHNTMSIESLDTFLNIKGGYHNGLRDVYFIRALGETPDIQSKISAIDRRMDKAMEENLLFYLRISELPKLFDKEDLEYYSAIFAEWSAGQSIKLKTRFSNQLLSSLLSAATKITIETLKKTRNNVTDTIVRNFVIKLWFWADKVLQQALPQWTEKLSIKIIADNVGKVQDYLFYYMITFLGCDVLLLNTKADINANEALLNLSCSFALGPFGGTEVPKYVPANREKRTSNEKKKTAAKREAPSANISTDRESQAHKGREKKAGSDMGRNLSRRTTVNSTVLQSTPADSERIYPGTSIISSSLRKEEKSFEDLAKLASSIVMIAVHNSCGEPVATGSGIMIGKKGFILTNYHVVQTGRLYAVRIEEDEKVYITNEVIKYNAQLDLAIIRIQKELDPLRLYDGKNKLVRGQKVVAIGSPLGLFNSVSDGIISGFRNIRNVDMIQFTAPISHGSSGGAVLNMLGEVIGISTAGIESGQNINLAISYEDIRLFAKGFS